MESFEGSDDNECIGNYQPKPAEELRATTMTLVAFLNGKVNVGAAYHLLPITYVPALARRTAKKVEFPLCKAGSILSIRAGNTIRGSLAENDKKSFPHSITMDVSISHKNLSLKLSESTIHFCGATCLEDGVEATEYVIQHLYALQRLVEKMYPNEEVFRETIQWVKDISLGAPVTKVVTVERTVEPGNEVQVAVECSTDHTIYYSGELVPPHLDFEVVTHLLELSRDFQYHSDFCSKLDYLARIRQVVIEDLSLDTIEHAMVNYNFSLGFEVNRAALVEVLNGKDGFCSDFDSQLTRFARIEIPYEPTGCRIKRKRGKVPRITLIVYRNGAVMYSGPDEATFPVVYNLLMKNICEYYDYIAIPSN